MSYQTGFLNHFATEAVAGALPEGRNSPQRPAFGLYAESALDELDDKLFESDGGDTTAAAAAMAAASFVHASVRGSLCFRAAC